MAVSRDRREGRGARPPGRRGRPRPRTPCGWRAPERAQGSGPRAHRGRPRVGFWARGVTMQARTPRSGAASSPCGSMPASSTGTGSGARPSAPSEVEHRRYSRDPRPPRGRPAAAAPGARARRRPWRPPTTARSPAGCRRPRGHAQGEAHQFGMVGRRPVEAGRVASSAASAGRRGGRKRGVGVAGGQVPQARRDDEVGPRRGQGRPRAHEGPVAALSLQDPAQAERAIGGGHRGGAQAAGLWPGPAPWAPALPGRRRPSRMRGLQALRHRVRVSPSMPECIGSDIRYVL